MKDKICTKCKTGADAVALDASECICQYIMLCKDNNCPMYKPIKQKS